MSMPKIPDMSPKIDLNIKDSTKMILNSIAMQEMGLSHILNAEGEKLQCIIKKMQEESYICSDKLLEVNGSVNKLLKNILKNEMILQIKMEDAVELYDRIKSSEKDEEYIFGGCEDNADEEGINCEFINYEE